MYTRCPKCATVFRITAAQLRVAEGEVRCGNCTISFNALAGLTDDLPELTDAVILDSGADRAEDDDETPEIDSTTVDKQEQKVAESAESNLEFDAPEGAWSRFFVSADTDSNNQADGESDDVLDCELSDPGDRASAPTGDDFSPLEMETSDPDEWQIFLSELDDETGPETEDQNIDLQETDPQDGEVSRDEGRYGKEPDTGKAGIVLEADTANLPDESLVLGESMDESSSAPEPPLVVVDALTDFDADYDVVEQPNFGSETAYELNQDIPAGGFFDNRADEFPALFTEEAEDSDSAMHGDQQFPLRSLVMVLILGIAFVAQLVHYNRDKLATHPKYGPSVRRLYSSIGSPLYPNWDLRAFKVRGTEAVAGRSADSALDIVATIEIVGEESVGMPLVRVALQDRWANPVASRIFYPSEYLLGDKPIPALLAAGTTLQLEISVVDPGKEAQGYVIDICLPNRATGLQCQLERDPFQS